MFDLGRVEKLGGIKVPTDEIKTILENAWLRAGRRRRHRRSDTSVMEAGHPRCCGPRGGGRAHCGHRQHSSVPLPRRFGVARPVLTGAAACSPCPPSAGWARAGRGRDVVVPSPRSRPSSSAAGAASSSSPIRSRSISPPCAPSLIPGLLTAVERNQASRGFSGRRCCSSLGPGYRGDKPEDQYLGVAGVRAGTARVQGSGRQWHARPRRSACSMPRQMWWRCSARWESTRPRLRSRAMRPPGTTRPLGHAAAWTQDGARHISARFTLQL